MAADAEIMTMLVQHVVSQSTVKAVLGKDPCKVFPGDVPIRVKSGEIMPPWVNLKRLGWDEVRHMRGGTGTYVCQINVTVHAATATQAGEIYSIVRDVVANRWSEAWSERLWIHESEMTLGQQVELVEPDGSPSAWQQIEGELSITCCVLPA